MITAGIWMIFVRMAHIDEDSSADYDTKMFSDWRCLAGTSTLLSRRLCSGC